MKALLLSLVSVATLATAPAALANTFAGGAAAIRSMTGCYLVDYSYTETEGLKPGYERDKRVYDVNSNKSIKEWIYAIENGNHIRLQHVLFGVDLEGKLMEGSELRHQAEDWEFNADFLYDFTRPNYWQLKPLDPSNGLWTRRITNLDDGLRYQCAAAWDLTKANPEWSCSNFAPIPGRETRDMQRKDYNTLDRTTRVVAYGTSWLERQNNTKIIYENGVKTPLAKETGKNWYVRLPDSECAPALAFKADHEAFWNLLQETWEGVLTGDRDFAEKVIPGVRRYDRIMALEEEFPNVASDPAQRAAAKSAILRVIGEYRAN